MENLSLDFATIMMFVTAVVTYLFAELSKKFNWLENKYIPYQNAIIGIVSGLIVFWTGLSNNLGASIVICIMSAFSAGGGYDLVKSSKKGEDE